MAIAEYSTSTIDALSWLVDVGTAPRVRTMTQFAEDEIVLPNGPRRGMRLNLDTNPWVRLFLSEIDKEIWQEINSTGGRQGGKTLICSQLPAMYHLFEIGESVGYLIPDMELASYKWNNDLLPIIMATRYRDLLPRRGGGSRGGKFSEIEFTNGARLFFLTGGGSDAGRAGRTFRVLIVTETDKMDAAGGASEETDKISQAIHCTDAFGDRRRVYQECTLTTKSGRTWRDYESGTASRIVLRCPHCAGYVTPEREHLQGWKETDTAIEAMELAFYCCPACGERWSEQDRYQANLHAVLAHKCQTVGEDGVIEGEAPRTRTLGFRWSAVNNMFMPPGMVAAEEWALAHEEENQKKELKEREVLQYLWALPYSEPELAIEEYVDPKVILARPRVVRRGIVPEWTIALTVGIDIGKWGAHWTAIAWGENARGLVIDYGEKAFNSERQSVELAIMDGLRELRTEYLDKGWINEHGQWRAPDYVVIDSRYKTLQVRAFCAEAGARYISSLGWGATQKYPGCKTYITPSQVSQTIRKIGEGYNIAMSKTSRCLIVHINSDFWKSWVHARLKAPIDEAGSLGLFQVANQEDHKEFANHLAAERETIEFVPGRGNVVRWKQTYSQNHYLDSTALACVAGHIVGVRLVRPKAKAAEKKPEAAPAPAKKVDGWMGGRQRGGWMKR